MVEKLRIAAYTRISVDLELDKDNTSIENQKAIIGDYCKLHFPLSTVDYYEDRDKSGYSFDQRPSYYYDLRPKLMQGDYDILILKDLSRFSRRTGKGLAEFEDIVEHDIRIIAIGDGVDYDQDHTDDWMKIKLYFFVNEMPVTDASRKVLDVIASRQSKGEWICSVPYGYVITNSKKMLFEVDEPAAEVVRTVFRLYIDGWGYKRIANHLTDQHIPTPRMREKARKEALGDEYKGKVREQWSIVTVSEILNNDFYIGTLRERKYHRKKINGCDMALDKSEHIVFEAHHEAIVDYRMFATAQELLKQRSTNHYRGVKKYDNTYSGYLFCGDCGSPLFAMSRKDLAPAYTCGTYHVRGRAGCTSHHVRADLLDAVLKEYIQKIKDNSEAMIHVLQAVLENEERSTSNGLQAAEELKRQIEDAREELKVLAHQKIRDLARHKGNAQVLEETYDALIEEANHRIEGLGNQLAMVADATNTTVKVNRVARTVIELFDELLAKDKLDKNDLYLIIDRIIVYEDRIEVKLKADVDELLRTGTIEHLAHDDEDEDAANFNSDMENIEKVTRDLSFVTAQRARNQRGKVFHVNVISGGDPLEIYTDREGEVIFKKYSPIGELAGFAAQYAETLHKTCSLAVVICDRDAVIACSGVPRKEFADKALSDELETIIEGRTLYVWHEGEDKRPVLATAGDEHYIGCAMPILSEGDIIGCVVSVHSGDEQKRTGAPTADVETKLIQTAATFLGKQLES